jgi:formylglycine-generating enzyme required for sulfatase activity
MRKQLQCLFIGFLILTIGGQTGAQVTNFGIVQIGQQSLLYWPLSSTNFVVQTSTNVVSPNWVNAANAVSVNAVEVSNLAPEGYFRLAAQTNAPAMAGMVLIPAGSFIMGNYLFFNVATNDPDISDANPTNISLSAFYVDANLVSYALWTNVFAYATNQGYGFVNSGSGKGPNYPVESVDWFDCVKWCNARSQQAGLAPCYFTDAGYTQIYTNGEPLVHLNFTNNGYRLPTEAEWEEAARGGLAGNRFPWGNSISESQANYHSVTIFGYDLGPNGLNAIGSLGGTNPATGPIGSFAPNTFGLYDMAGNLDEWCWDWYGSPYGQPSTTNPTGIKSGFYRVLRGGEWGIDCDYLRCAWRSYDYPTNVISRYGFRCVRDSN